MVISGIETTHSNVDKEIILEAFPISCLYAYENIVAALAHGTELNIKYTNFIVNKSFEINFSANTDSKGIITNLDIIAKIDDISFIGFSNFVFANPTPIINPHTGLLILLNDEIVSLNT